MTAHESHSWGPHPNGLRWVTCQDCTVLLHEPEADLACVGDPSLVIEGRTARRAQLNRRLEVLAVAESGAVPHTTVSFGLFQTIGRRRGT